MDDNSQSDFPLHSSSSQEIISPQPQNIRYSGEACTKMEADAKVKGNFPSSTVSAQSGEPRFFSQRRNCLIFEMVTLASPPPFDRVVPRAVVVAWRPCRIDTL